MKIELSLQRGGYRVRYLIEAPISIRPAAISNTIPRCTCIKFEDHRNFALIVIARVFKLAGVTRKWIHLHPTILHCYVSVCCRAHQPKFNPTTIALLFHVFPEAIREQYSSKTAVKKPIFWYL